MPVDEPDDELEGGLPPHPMDRVWFHPSELGAAMASWRTGAAKRRDWGFAALVALLSVVATVSVLAAAGAFSGHGTVTRTSVASVLPGAALESAAGAVDTAAPSVVSLRVVTGGGELQGSGVAVDTTRVLTSASLVAAATMITVASADGHLNAAKVVGTDAETDLTLLDVDNGQLPGAKLGRSDSLRVGDSVVALGYGAGNPWVGGGLVSALHQVASMPAGGTLASLVETDVRLKPVAAGGALVNSDGLVVGILSAALPGRAIPIDLAHDVTQQLELTGTAHHGWLGVVAVDASDRPGGGAMIASVSAASPAAALGLAPGDVITSVAGERVANAGDLAASVEERRPGDPAPITAWRGGEHTNRQLSLGDRPADVGPALGVAA
jgi:S1-C subfamily serine protease